MSNLIKDVLATVKGAKFAGFTYTAKETGETAKFVVLLGADYGTTIANSLSELQARFPDVAAVVGDETDVKTLVKVLDTEKAAAAELLASFNATIKARETGGYNPAYTKPHVYNATDVKGVNIHKTDDSLEVAGLVISKVVIKEGVYKTVNSAAKTIAKAKIRKSLPVGKYRSFCLEKENLESVRFSQVETVNA